MCPEIASPRIAFDSQIVTYFLRANRGDEFPPAAPLSELDHQHVAAIRLALAYHVYVLPTVRLECSRIRDLDRHEEHGRFLNSFFNDILAAGFDSAKVNTMAEELLHLHGDIDDCRVVAEAIEGRLNVLVTNDRDLRVRLGAHVAPFQLLAPTEAWRLFARPAVRVPHPDHPLATTDWWEWETPGPEGGVK